MSKWRRFVRRGAPILALILTLGLIPLYPTGAGDWGVVGKVWSWLVGVWLADGAGSGGTEPSGTAGDDDRGPELDPDGTTSDGDRGPELDPNG